MLTPSPALHPAGSALPGRRAARAAAGVQGVLPGLGLSLLIGLLAVALAEAGGLAARGVSALVIAITLGIVVGNSAYPRWAARCGAGVGLSRQALLRAGIVLYGLRLTLHDIAQIGWAGVLADAAVLCSTFGLALWIGVRRLGLARDTAILIGAGSSICGAAAVLATAPVLKARADQVAVAVATVVVFGTLAVGVYPLLHAWALPWVGDAARLDRFFGVYIGSTVHEVAQVVAAGQAIGAAAGQDAVIAKLVRVLMLAPFLVLLSGWLSGWLWLPGTGGRGRPAPAAIGSDGGRPRRPPARAIAIPWFAIAFMAVVALNSAISLPAALNQALQQLDTLLLATAMAALGLTTHHSAIRRAGVKPLLLAGLLFAWLIAGGALINALALALAG